MACNYRKYGGEDGLFLKLKVVFPKKVRSRRPIDVIYIVITRLEMSKLKSEISKINKHAFMIMTSVKDAKGGMIKKKSSKKFDK